MKKIINYLLLSLIILLPIKLNAASGRLDVTCPTTAEPGQTISCNISLTATEGTLKSTEADFDLGGLTYVSFTSPYISSSRFEVSTKRMVIGINDDVTSTVSLGELNLTVPSSASNNQTYTVSFSNIISSSDTYEDVYIESASSVITVKIKSTINTLDSLTIDKINFVFNKDTLTYNLNTDESTINISATRTDPLSIMTGDIGQKTLNYGLNTFKITVTSESGVPRVYVLNITRPEPAKPSPSPSGGNNQSTNNNTNNNQGQTPAKSSNNKLSSLTANGNKLDITKDVIEYKIENDVEKLDIKYTLEDSKAKVTITGNENLKVGENTITITVTAEDGSTKTYTLKVTKMEAGKTLDTNNYLKSLEIDNYKIDFNKETQKYTIKIKNEKTLNIKATAEKETSSVTIIDNTNLKNNSKITVRVTAEDGSIRDYIITVNVSSLPIIPIIIGSIILIVVVLTVVIMKNKKKN